MYKRQPELGANALSAGARIVVAVDREQARLASQTALTAVGNGTVSVTELQSGLARNIIPDACELYVGRRIAPGEDVKEVQDALYDLIRDAASPLEASIETAYGEGSAAFYQDPTSPLVLDLARLADQEATTAEFGTNALKYGPIADECVVFGPGSIDQAHQAIEWVDIAQLERAVDIYRAWLIQ